MSNANRRDAIVEMAHYLSQQFDAVPAAQWRAILEKAAQASGDRPPDIADAVEQILNLVRASEEQTLPLAAWLAFASGAPPALDQVRAAGLRPEGGGEPDFGAQPDMLIAPDRYFTQAIDAVPVDGVLEVRLPRLHPGPRDGVALVWVGNDAGSARDKRKWREQRDQLAAAPWRFPSGETYRPIDTFPSSLGTTSLAEARFMRQVLAIPAHLIEASGRARESVQATVPWPFNAAPVLKGNAALIGVSGVQPLAVVRSATADADGNAEVRLSDGPTQYAPISIERTGAQARVSSIPRRHAAATGAGWSFDPIDNVVLLNGLAPLETLDLRIQLRVEQRRSPETGMTTAWTGPGALRWQAIASLADPALAPSKSFPTSIVTAADISSTLLSLDPFPETLDLRSAHVTVEARIFVVDGRLALGQQVTIAARRRVASNSVAELENALSAMLRSFAFWHGPLRVRLHHDP